MPTLPRVGEPCSESAEVSQHPGANQYLSCLELSKVLTSPGSWSREGTGVLWLSPMARELVVAATAGGSMVI